MNIQSMQVMEQSTAMRQSLKEICGGVDLFEVR
jgi:hypothetical protein